MSYSTESVCTVRRMSRVRKPFATLRSLLMMASQSLRRRTASSSAAARATSEVSSGAVPPRINDSTRFSMEIMLLMASWFSTRASTSFELKGFTM